MCLPFMPVQLVYSCTLLFCFFCFCCSEDNNIKCKLTTTSEDDDDGLPALLEVLWPINNFPLLVVHLCMYSQYCSIHIIMIASLAHLLTHTHTGRHTHTEVQTERSNKHGSLFLTLSKPLILYFYSLRFFFRSSPLF